MKSPTMQEIIRRLNTFWAEQGCVVHEGYDLEVGAGTFNPATFLRSLGPEPYMAAYAEPCRRPTDGRYGENPNRFQHYFQYQVILKPSPLDIQDRYLQSLEAIGIDLKQHDIRFVHDDWESPTLGASGLGWEVWCDGMEVTQFTYFQSVAGVQVKPVTGELTYGVERLAMYLQKVDNGYDLQWNERLSYGDLFKRSEYEFSTYNFELASTEMWQKHFEDFEREAKSLVEQGYPIPAYDFVMKASHAFNLLDARGVISVTERTGYITRIRDIACLVAQAYLESREKQGHPLLKRWPEESHETPVDPEGHGISKNPEERDDFLLEIGSEELPAAFVPIGCANLKKDLTALLDKMEVSYDSVEVMGTPRRLTAYIKNLARGIVPKVVEKRGPVLSAAFDSEGKPSKAGEGFFRSIGLDQVPNGQDIADGKVPNLEVKTVKDKDYIFATVTKQDFDPATWVNLQRELPKLILNIDFPKKMRWSDLDIAYARPLRWLVAMHGSDVIPCHIGPVASGNSSRGHRQLDDVTVSIDSPTSYVDQLREHKVLVDIDERCSSIEKQLREIEAKHNCEAMSRDKVIQEVLHLTEWPLLTDAPFDASFLRAPKEVLISEMVEHQKYFPLANTEGSLLNRFVITADTTPNDEIRHGNQKVLSARLSDGVFLYEQDLKVPLDQWNEKLKAITFQQKLGSVHDKVERLTKHVKELHNSYCAQNPQADQGDLNKILRAASLCKADLASEMVGEFPELQGIIGRYYALAHGEDAEVALAIEEHWMPRGEKDSLPSSLTGTFVSLAEKFDNIIGCFLVGLQPRSSSDPYGLRRQVLAILRILIQHKWHLPITELLEQCAKAFPHEGAEDALIQIRDFFSNRIKTVFQNYGFQKDEIEASLASGFNDIYDIYCKTQALHDIRNNDPRFPALYEAFKRARGQLEGQEAHELKEELLTEEAEIALYKTLKTVASDFEKAIKNRDYKAAYLLTAELQAPIAKLFDEVRILAEDEATKNNRVALLQETFEPFKELLDLSKLQEVKAGSSSR